MEQIAAEISKIQTFHGLLLTVLKFHGDKVAIIDADNESKKVTFSQIQNTALRIANFLVDGASFRKQEIVATLVSNCWEHIAIHIGTSLVGGIFTAVSSHFTNFEVSHQLRDSDATVVFVDGVYLKKVLSALPECPKIRKIVVLGNFNRVMKANIDIQGWYTVNRYPARMPETPVIDAKNDICWLPYSSGTTGLPKGVMITHKNYLEHFKTVVLYNIQTFSKNLELPQHEFAVCFMPIYHAMGYNTLIGNIVKGSTAVLMRKYSFEHLLFLIQKYKANYISAAPTIAQQIARNPIVKKYDLSSIRLIGTGGSKLDEGTMKIIMKQFPNVQLMAQGYGMTEAVTVLATSRGKKSDSLNCVGTPLPGVEVQIFDPDTDEILPRGKVGEVRFKAPYTMKGYWKNPEATRACYDNNGYFKTGDIGYLDSEGLLFINDRIKELIKVKSFQVPPAELEAVLMTHPLISDCAVIGISDDVSGEVPKAFVVRSSKRLTREEVVKYIAERLSYYKHLKGGVEFVEEIPRTASGKIMRRYFKEREAAHRKSKL